MDAVKLSKVADEDEIFPVWIPEEKRSKKGWEIAVT